jgi:uncharacterized membrane protein
MEFISFLLFVILIIIGLTSLYFQIKSYNLMEKESNILKDDYK